MPLTVALHCSMVKKPQLVPPALGAYSAHHRVLSQGRAVAGVCVSTAGTMTSTDIVPKRIRRPSYCYWNNTVHPSICPLTAQPTHHEPRLSDGGAAHFGRLTPGCTPRPGCILQTILQTICKPIPRHNLLQQAALSNGGGFFKSRPC